MMDAEQQDTNQVNPSSPREITFEGNRIMIFFVAATILLFYSGDKLFDLIWEGEERLLEVNVPMWTKYAAVLVGIVLHELIHGLIFGLHAKNGFRSVKFGFSKTMGSPYCHCKDALKAKYYRRAGIAPTIILGILPLFFAMITGVNWIKTFGILFIVGGLGDILLWVKLLKFDSNLMVRDHPEKMGFILE
jgi:hypothetical protein